MHGMHLLCVARSCIRVEQALGGAGEARVHTCQGQPRPVYWGTATLEAPLTLLHSAKGYLANFDPAPTPQSSVT